MFTKVEGLTARCSFGWADVITRKARALEHTERWRDELGRKESDKVVRAQLSQHLDTFFNCAEYIKVIVPGSVAPLYVGSHVIFVGSNKRFSLGAFDLTLRSSAIKALRHAAIPQLPEKEEIGGYLLVPATNTTVNTATLLLNVHQEARLSSPLTSDDWRTLLA